LYYYYPLRIAATDPVIKERRLAGTESAFRDDIVAMIVGRRSADALKRLTETGFKCNILTF
jgi:hypothetical protein